MQSRHSLFICATILFTMTAYAQVPIIFDTDMGNDIDDAMALAIIHQLERRGAVELLAVIGGVVGRRGWFWYCGGLCHGAFLVSLASGGRADGLGADIAGDGAEPCCEFVGAFDIVEFAVGAEEGFLERIVGIGEVASSADGGDQWRVGVVDAPEGVVITLAGGLEIVVVDSHHSPRGRRGRRVSGNLV